WSRHRIKPRQTRRRNPRRPRESQEPAGRRCALFNPDSGGGMMPVSRILLVEDEPGLLLTLTDRLISQGYEVASESDGESGLARATSPTEPFDLVLLDVMLPKKNGFEV